MTGNPDPISTDLFTGARWFAGKQHDLERVERRATIFAADGATVELVAAVATAGEDEYLLPLRDGRECDGTDPLWPALARAAGFDACAATGFLADDLSNTVVVLDEHAVLKLYRRPAPGPHPEPVALRALASSPHAPSLLGELRHGDATVLVVQELVAGDPVGWEELIMRLAQGDPASGDPAALAETTAHLHRTLAAELGTTEVTLDVSAGPLTGELADLTPRVAEVLASLAARGPVSAQRIHGDLHVAQFLRAPDRFVVVDWEGEPGKSLGERARPLPPARDLGSLRLSLAHAARAAHRHNPDFDWRVWSTAARREALHAYEVASGPVDPVLLHALEIAKELDELDYAARYLPEWLYAPTAVLPFILEEAA